MRVARFGSRASKALGHFVSVVKVFSDNFNRTSASNLGTSSSGGLWEAIRGTWTANGSVATTATAASSYPISVHDMGSKNVVINLDVTQGSGAAFWVTDTQNWWGAFPWQDTVTTWSSECASFSSSCTSFTSSCTGGSSCTSSSCSAWTSSCSSSSCSSWVPTYVGPGYTSECVTWSCSGWTSSCSSFSCTAWTCGSWSSTCNSFTSSCSSWTSTSSSSPGTRYLRVIRSLTNTVTTIVEGTVSAAIASIRVRLSGDTITASAFSSAGQVSQTGGDVVNTPTSPLKANKHGIILAPGGYSQGTTADNITMTS